MDEFGTILKYGGILGAMALMVFVVRARRKGHQQWLDETCDRECCEHLRPVVEELRRRGHAVVRIGMRAPDMPLEIYMLPQWNPAALMKELNLQMPVCLSDRGVLYCQECWCELSA